MMQCTHRLAAFAASRRCLALPLPLPAAAQPAPGADPALAQTPQPDLVKMVPAGHAAGKPFTVAVSLGSPPDDFRNEKGEIVGWEIDIMRAATQALGLRARICGRRRSTR